jgi:hypothetical protein
MRPRGDACKNVLTKYTLSGSRRIFAANRDERRVDLFVLTILCVENLLVRGASLDFFLFPFSFFLCPLALTLAAVMTAVCLACARRRR